MLIMLLELLAGITAILIIGFHLLMDGVPFAIIVCDLMAILGAWLPMFLRR